MAPARLRDLASPAPHSDGVPLSLASVGSGQRPLQQPTEAAFLGEPPAAGPAAASFRSSCLPSSQALTNAFSPPSPAPPPVLAPPSRLSLAHGTPPSLLLQHLRQLIALLELQLQQRSRGGATDSSSGRGGSSVPARPQGAGSGALREAAACAPVALPASPAAAPPCPSSVAQMRSQLLLPLLPLAPVPPSLRPSQQQLLCSAAPVPLPVPRSQRPAALQPAEAAVPTPAAAAAAASVRWAEVEEVYALGREVGRGHFGVVRACVERESGAEFACKSVALANVKRKEDISELRAEVEMLLALRLQPNVLRLRELFISPTEVHLVTELCQGGDLFDAIARRKRLNEAQAAAVFGQLALLVHQLHSLGVCHRDIKPENVLLAPSASQPPPASSQGPTSPPPSACAPSPPASAFPLGVVKLADFGLALCLPPGCHGKGLAGSPFYMAPEVVRQKPYGLPVDVWSLGVLLYTVLAGCLPFYGKNQAAVFAAVVRAEPDLTRAPWPLVSPEAKHLIGRMLTADPARRITPAAVLAHPWLQRYAPLLRQQQSALQLQASREAGLLAACAAQRAGLGAGRQRPAAGSGSEQWMQQQQQQQQQQQRDEDEELAEDGAQLRPSMGPVVPATEQDTGFVGRDCRANPAYTSAEQRGQQAAAAVAAAPPLHHAAPLQPPQVPVPCCPAPPPSFLPPPASLGHPSPRMLHQALARITEQHRGARGAGSASPANTGSASHRALPAAQENAPLPLQRTEEPFLGQHQVAAAPPRFPFLPPHSVQPLAGAQASAALFSQPPVPPTCRGQAAPLGASAPSPASGGSPGAAAAPASGGGARVALALDDRKGAGGEGRPAPSHAAAWVSSAAGGPFQLPPPLWGTTEFSSVMPRLQRPIPTQKEPQLLHAAAVLPGTAAPAARVTAPALLPALPSSPVLPPCVGPIARRSHRLPPPLLLHCIPTPPSSPTVTSTPSSPVLPPVQPSLSIAHPFAGLHQGNVLSPQPPKQLLVPPAAHPLGPSPLASRHTLAGRVAQPGDRPEVRRMPLMRLPTSIPLVRDGGEVEATAMGSSLAVEESAGQGRTGSPGKSSEGSSMKLVSREVWEESARSEACASAVMAGTQALECL